MLGRFHAGLGWRISFAEDRHPRRFLVLALFVAPFLVQREIAREQYGLTGGSKHGPAGPVGQLDGRPLQPSRGHLACERAVIDKLVQARVIARCGAAL